MTVKVKVSVPEFECTVEQAVILQEVLASFKKDSIKDIADLFDEKMIPLQEFEKTATYERIQDNK